jgi:hypothetical protein
MNEHPSATLPRAGRVTSAADFWTWQAVQERMTEAMRHWRRSHDMDARFSLGGRISSIWRLAFTDRMDLIRHELLTELPAADAPKPLPLSRDDMARMTEASEWMRFVPEADRRLVVIVLGKLASGHKTVPWLTIWKALGRGRPGPDGLRSRYSRAITCIANELNGGNLRRQAVKPPVSSSIK